MFCRSCRRPVVCLCRRMAPPQCLPDPVFNPVSNLLQQPAGPIELGGKNRQPGRNDHECRAGSDEHHHAHRHHRQPQDENNPLAQPSRQADRQIERLHEVTGSRCRIGRG